MPILLHGPGYNLAGMVGVLPSWALLGGFAISAQVALVRQHNVNAKMSASACTRSMPGLLLHFCINMAMNAKILLLYQ